MKSILRASLLALTLLVGHSALAQSGGDPEACCPVGAFDAGELAVGFEPGTTSDRVQAISTELGAQAFELVFEIEG